MHLDWTLFLHPTCSIILKLQQAVYFRQENNPKNLSAYFNSERLLQPLKQRRVLKLKLI